MKTCDNQFLLVYCSVNITNGLSTNNPFVIHLIFSTDTWQNHQQSCYVGLYKKPATLAAPHQSATLLHRIPISFSMFLHELYQDGIFRYRPRPLFQALTDPLWNCSLSPLHHYYSINIVAVPIAHHLGWISTPSTPPLAAVARLKLFCFVVMFVELFEGLNRAQICLWVFWLRILIVLVLFSLMTIVCSYLHASIVCTFFIICCASSLLH